MSDSQFDPPLREPGPRGCLRAWEPLEVEVLERPGR